MPRRYFCQVIVSKLTGLCQESKKFSGRHEATQMQLDQAALRLLPRVFPALALYRLEICMKKLLNKVLPALLALIPVIAFSATASDTPNDAQIAAIVVAANTVDVNAGKLAEKQAVDSDVKAFAKMMVTDHTSVNDQAKALAKKLKLSPEENDTSKRLKKDGEANVDRLKAMKGKEFDKAYIDKEVSYHQSVIDLMDKTLIVHAREPSLKDLLVKVRPNFVAHLERAKQIQSSLK